MRCIVEERLSCCVVLANKHCLLWCCNNNVLLLVQCKQSCLWEVIVASGFCWCPRMPRVFCFVFQSSIHYFSPTQSTTRNLLIFARRSRWLLFSSLGSTLLLRETNYLLPSACPQRDHVRGKRTNDRTNENSRIRSCSSAFHYRWCFSFRFSRSSFSARVYSLVARDSIHTRWR